MYYLSKLYFDASMMMESHASTIRIKSFVLSSF